MGAGSPWDMVIVGAGAAGLTAAIYGGRARLSTLLLERLAPGGQAALTEAIENYPGFPEGISGPDLVRRMEQQARRFGATLLSAEVVTVIPAPEAIVVRTGAGEQQGRTVIIASGASPRELGVKGEHEYRGRGVSYCATCDGAFFRGKRVAVVGGGDSAVEEALFLTGFADRVFLIHRREEFRAARSLQERASASPGLEFVLDNVVEEILGGETVSGVRVRNVRSGDTRELEVQGVFIYIGLKPNTGFLPAQVKLDDEGYVVTDEEMRTSVTGIYAAGDVRSKSLRQVATAVGDGAVAAASAQRHVARAGWARESRGEGAR